MGATGSKKELKDGTPDFTIPSGLYHSLNWDLKAVKRLILGKRLAPLFPGQEECTDGDLEECPICFLFYPGGLNRSTCCKKGICTECFLQIKKPNGQAFCPFCQRSNYNVVFSGPLSKEEKEKDAWEQRQVIEAKTRMRNEEIEQDLKREQQKRERALTTSGTFSYEHISPSLNPPNGMEVFTSQSLPASSPLSENSFSSFSTSYPPPTRDIKKKEVEMEDLMLQEALRLSLLKSDIIGASDTDTLSDDGSKTSDVEELLQTSNEDNREDLELALALALSLQNVIK